MEHGFQKAIGTDKQKEIHARMKTMTFYRLIIYRMGIKHHNNFYYNILTDNYYGTLTRSRIFDSKTSSIILTPP